MRDVTLLVDELLVLEVLDVGWLVELEVVRVVLVWAGPLIVEVLVLVAPLSITSVCVLVYVLLLLTYVLTEVVVVVRVKGAEADDRVVDVEVPLLEVPEGAIQDQSNDSDD